MKFHLHVSGQRNDVELSCECVDDHATDAPEPDAVPRVEVVRQIPPVRRNLSTENSDAERRNGDSRRRESARAQIVVAARMIVPPIIVSLTIDGPQGCRSQTGTAADSADVKVDVVVVSDEAFGV